MSQNTNGFVNLDYVVKQCLVDIEDYSSTQYQRFLQFANLGFADLNLFVTENIKVKYLTVNANKTVDLPIDFIFHTKIGIANGGTIWTLTEKDDMLLPRTTDECGDVQATALSEDCNNSYDNTYGHYFADHFRNGQYVGEMYGVKGGLNDGGYFRIDHEKRQIAFNSEMAATEIILEYKSSGVAVDGSTIVPREAVPALTAYVHWRRIQYLDKKPTGTKKDYQTQYYIEFDKLKQLTWSFTIDEYLDSVYRVVSSGPRR